jgi:Mycoplasma protein of unknown function, DUF285
MDTNIANINQTGENELPHQKHHRRNIISTVEQSPITAGPEPPTFEASPPLPVVHPADMIGPDTMVQSLAASQVTDSMVSHATMRSQPLATLMASGAMPTFKGQAQSIVRENPSLQHDDAIATRAYNENNGDQRHYSPRNSSSQSPNNNTSVYLDEGQETIPVVQAVPCESSRTASALQEENYHHGWSERRSTTNGPNMDYNGHVETKPSPMPPHSLSSQRRRPWTVWAARSAMVAGAILVVAASASGILCRTRQCPFLHGLRRNGQQPHSNVDTAMTPNAPPSPPESTNVPPPPVYVAFSTTNELYQAVDAYQEAATAATALLYGDNSVQDSDVARRYGYPMATWNVSRLTNFSSVFDGTRNPNLVDTFDEDLSGWDVSRATEMFRTFFGLSQYTGRGLEQWNVGRVTNLRSMFSFAYNFRGNISYWSVSKAVFLKRMFSDSLFNVDISLWDVSNAQDLGWMVRFGLGATVSAWLAFLGLARC